MPIGNEDKGAIIDQLENARTKGSRLVVALTFAGRGADAQAAMAKVTILGGKIDELLAVSMKEWSGTAQPLIDGMTTTNRRLQSDIADIKKKKDMANKAVRALGRLDEAIGTATEILSRLPVA